MEKENSDDFTTPEREAPQNFDFTTHSAPQNFDFTTHSAPQNFDFTSPSAPQNFETTRSVPAPPDTFKKIICDFTADLTNVFPEYSSAWAVWNESMSDDELKNLFEYCLVFYPGRFFDILNKNVDIFSNDADTNTLFLPNVEFKALYNCDGVTDKTRDSLWKYLQLILFSTVQAMDNSSFFGDSLKMFEDIDMNDIHTKLEDVMNDMAKMFGSCKQNTDKETTETEHSDGEHSDEEDDAADTNDMPDPFMNFGRRRGGGGGGPLPFNPEEMHNHINSLLNGKIGILAKELAEDVSREFNDDILQMGEGDLTGDTAHDTKSMLEKLMKNPTKIMDLVKKVGGKLDQKIKSGDISQEELMREVSDIMGKMKDIPGMGDMESFLKKMGRNFGGGGGAGGRIDENALARASKNQQMKDKLRARLETKKRTQVEAAISVMQKSAEFAAAEAAAEAAAAELITPGPIVTSNKKKNSGGKKKGKK